MYVCVCMYVLYMYVCVRIYVCMCVYVCIIYVCLCTYVCMCVCIMYVYMHFFYYILLLSSQYAPLHYAILHARFVLFTFIWLFVVSFS